MAKTNESKFAISYNIHSGNSVILLYVFDISIRPLAQISFAFCILHKVMGYFLVILIRNPNHIFFIVTYIAYKGSSLILFYEVLKFICVQARPWILHIIQIIITICISIHIS